jgi:hypothetical protein
LLLVEPPGSGLVWIVHAVLFRCSIRVWDLVPLLYEPTAQALDDEVAATPLREFKAVEPPSSGLLCTFQPVPF